MRADRSFAPRRPTRESHAGCLCTVAWRHRGTVDEGAELPM